MNLAKRVRYNADYPNYVRQSEFLRLARNFHDAYINCIEITPFNAPKYYLGCQAIELALKSYLLRMGLSIDEIMNVFRHDIGKLLNEAVAKGLKLSDSDIDHIHSLSYVHTQLWNRYPIEWSSPIYVVDQNDAAIEKLLEAVGP